MPLLAALSLLAALPAALSLPPSFFLDPNPFTDEDLTRLPSNPTPTTGALPLPLEDALSPLLTEIPQLWSLVPPITTTSTSHGPKPTNTPASRQPLYPLPSDIPSPSSASTLHKKSPIDQDRLFDIKYLPPDAITKAKPRVFPNGDAIPLCGCYKCPWAGTNDVRYKGPVWVPKGLRGGEGMSLGILDKEGKVIYWLPGWRVPSDVVTVTVTETVKATERPVVNSGFDYSNSG